ncbi:helix-turn-helix transcriptional regulator [Parafrankia elaeagni]|uniref:helix-turn-helix transcriptional regulator n=1 Tax=Parafrankia elaeagni TaxID=222534 RepID=UPI0006862785|nr:helix-turn-helix transcriptional regulator [Parafrankia elaeagni]
MFDWFSLGKRRSKFGRFLDKHELTQQQVVEKSGVSRGTISRICQADNLAPTMKNARKIIQAVRDLTGKNVDYDDFWSM